MFTIKNNFKHHRHHLQLAIFLSFVAGLINVCSFLSLQRFTTNVTGHFALFVEEILKSDFRMALTFLGFVLAFFLGSIVSNFLVEIITRINDTFKYTIPVAIEAILIFIAGSAYRLYDPANPDIIAALLLFSMGLQNSLVTRVSNSVVRTSHLTGLFTDLGIEVSQLFFIKNHFKRTKIKISIQLRLTIITFFFLGGLVGGVLYGYIGLRTFWVATVILIITLLFDIIKKQLFKFTQLITQIQEKI